MKLRAKTYRRLLYFGAFAASFGLCVAVGMRLRSAETSSAARHATLPDSKEYYLGEYREGLEGYVILHGLEGVLAPLKAADVLFLGSSHMKYAVRRESLEPFQRSGLRFYNMAFGYTEQILLPQAVIRRHDLRPRWVVVNVDPFFQDYTSGFNEAVLGSTRFDAWKARFEAGLTFRAERLLAAITPFPVVTGVEFRAISDGTLRRILPKHEPVAATPPACEETRTNFDAYLLRVARRFRDEMEKRGARLVLTSIPPEPPCRARMLAAALAVPLLLPSVGGLSTFDGSHLDDDSAVRFGDALLRELEPIVRAAPARSLSGEG